MEPIHIFLCSAAGAAMVSGFFSIALYKMQRQDAQSDKTAIETQALQYIMLYIIQERCKEHLQDGSITLDARRSLHKWHDVYHDGLGGNGDADLLMSQVDKLPLA